MDPLSQVIDALSLPRFSVLDGSPVANGAQRRLNNFHETPPFKFRADLNEKVVLWNGDITLLSVGAILNPTSESFSDRNPISEAIYKMAGPELKHCLKTEIKSCRTGDAKISSAFKLPSRHVIHTVGPRYNVKYRTAAESTLYSCYRSALQLARENHLSTIAIPCLHSERRGYPVTDGAHIAIRTVRRFMEKYPDDIELVVFVTGNEYLEYKGLLPLYFPRNEEEEAFSAKALPEDIGNELGEPVIEERMIRIDPQPHEKLKRTGEDDVVTDENEEPSEEDLIPCGTNPFLTMAPDQDTTRREKVKSQMLSSGEDKLKRYEAYKKKARHENIKDLIDLRCIYRVGMDSLGREVVVFVGKMYPAAKVPPGQAIAFFISQLDTVVNKPFVVVYFCTESEPENVYDSDFYRKAYSVLDDRYINNLRALYVVHGNFKLKASLWWFLTFSAPEIKDKVHQIQGLQYLYDFIIPQQLSLPQFIIEHDRAVNGTNYHHTRPVEHVDTGAL